MYLQEEPSSNPSDEPPESTDATPSPYEPTLLTMVHKSLTHGDDDASDIYLALNSLNYQNHKSLELGIVVKRVDLVFFAFLCCIDQSLINKGID